MLNLIKAAKAGNTAAVKAALAAGADIHAANDDALRWASENGHLEVVKILKEHSAPKATNEELLAQLQKIGKELERRGVKFTLLNL